MDRNIDTFKGSSGVGLSKVNPKECEHAKPYMVDNGVLDIYSCKRFSGNCYFEPNGGKPFKKMCE
jgi:hypothetical protein